MSELRTQNTERTMAHIEAQLDEVLAELKAIKSAFPEDEYGNMDGTGHRRYHEEMIAAARAQTAFWNDLKNELVRKGLFGLLVIALGLMFTGLMVKTGITWGGPK